MAYYIDSPLIKWPRTVDACHVILWFSQYWGVFLTVTASDDDMRRVLIPIFSEYGALIRILLQRLGRLGAFRPSGIQRWHSSRCRTLVRYRFIDSSRALYDPFTCFVTRTSLLEAGNSKLKAYVISSLSEFVKIRSAPEPSLLEALSMNNVQSGVLSGIWVGVVVASSDIFGRILIEDSAMKSATTCPFIADLGLYLISCSPSSMTHLASRPEFSDLSNTCRIGWFVNTHIVYAWKYLRSRCAVCTSARANFSSGG
ncbi:hypothetical protein Tco_0892019 [Tanacetum coccineum]|uniref:Uncharacterized protein n=1 Tax=Tanacetum coccineum TaxID=301880 RepID=A0ABQ5C7J0_9ASTR